MRVAGVDLAVCALVAARVGSVVVCESGVGSCAGVASLWRALRSV